MLQELLNPNSKKRCLTIKVDKFTLSIHPYCYQKVGMTENMKFRLKCKENPEHNREFDDIAEMVEYINKFIFTCVIDLMV